MTINTITISNQKDKLMNNSVRILNEIIPSFIDYPDNESLCLCVVMMGCVHNCKGCQNPLFQNSNYVNGTRTISVKDLCLELKELCRRNETNKICLSGGDPLSPFNISFTKDLLEKLKEYDVCIYTGYDIDYVMKNDVKGFKFIKCGKFDLTQKRDSEKDDEKIIFASPNQSLYNADYELLSKNGIYYFN